MPRDARAIVFDLDDTLYPYRRFLSSGFRQVARYLERTAGLDARTTWRRLLAASRGPSRGQELQAVTAEAGVPARDLAKLSALIRDHEPDLRLPAVSLRVLRRLRAEGWRLGVLTNGDPVVQARKVRALGVLPCVDAIVYATACGTGQGKPDPAAFAEVARRLGVAPRRVVMVGDDEACDVAGAIGAGMHAIRCTVWRRDGVSSGAHASTARLSEVSTLARVLIEEASGRHAA
jgi:putative hydrolase of the HAD superfamily